MANFDKALAFVLAQEGGYVDNPKDPGGATNQGITQRTYDTWQHRFGRGLKPVSQITSGEVRDIYEVLYWQAYGCDSLPDGWALFIFDAAVQHSPAEVNALKQHASLADAMWARLKYYDGLAAFATFGRGWLKRMTDLRGVLRFDYGEAI